MSAKRFYARRVPQIQPEDFQPMSPLFEVGFRCVTHRRVARKPCGYDELSANDRQVKDASGKVLATFDDNWQWLPARSMLISTPNHASSATIIIFTKPIAESEAPAATMDLYQQQHKLAVDRWSALIASGTQIDVPEPYVNNAWRSLIAAQYAILSGDDMNYGALNQYARKYSHESGESCQINA